MKALRTENLLRYCTFRDLVAELPFILMHPKPEEEPPLPITARPSPSHEPGNKEDGDDVAVDTNLIQLDT
jgi:beta-arrestin